MTIKDIAAQYIAAGWSVVPIVAGAKKAESNWRKRIYHPDDFGPDDGIAGKCGEPSGHRVDVDCDCPEAIRAAELLLPSTGLVHGRPSKLASHYWFLCPDIKTTQFTDVRSDGATGRAAAGQMLIEIRSTGGYTVLPPSVWTNKDNPTHTEVMAWEHERAPLSLTESELYEAVRDVALAALLARHWPGQGGRHALTGPLTGFLCQGGVASAKLIELVRTAAIIAHDDDIEDRVKFAAATVAKFRKGEKVTGGPVLAAELGEAVVTKMRHWLRLADADQLEEMNARHFVVRLGAKEVIALEEDGEDIVFQRRHDMEVRYANRFVQTGVDEDGKTKMAPLLDTWLKSKGRREYRTITFAPPPRKPHAQDFNLWRGFAVAPAEGCCDRFLEHTYSVICREDDLYFKYLINWLAQMVQEPGKPSEVAVMLKGDSGAGKGIFFRTLGELFGSHYAHLDNTQDMTGFNALISGKVFIFADESFWAGDKQHIGVLKRVISEPTIRITRKNLDSVIEPNCVHLGIASNEDWVYPAMARERRVFALEVSPNKSQDFRYFGNLVDEIENGGRGALLKMLLEHTLDHDLVRQLPRTAELRVQQGRSLVPEMQWWQECLYDEKIGNIQFSGLASTDEVFRFYAEWCVARKARTLGKIDFSRKLGKFISAHGNKPVRQSGELVRCWLVRDITDGRKFFDTWLGADSAEWPVIMNPPPAAPKPVIPF